ncbi:major capsid protein [Corallococcus sp. AS-1-6]|uniref:major capsid protein n=1 Tax=Corallococcus sp. AS-1-6 TaxID=2874599 RepID=UPI001CBBC0FB|nr:phage major capsid protein [Corallococcus sp. AS-1-6]MBZ4373263.1 phage major capsid protein [Corallococcus sp. AS-1-6]
MPSVILSEAAKLSNNDLVAGIIENIVTVDRFFGVLPFEPVEGPAAVYNRENVLGDVQMLGVGGTITAKAATTFTQVTSPLKRIVGDAEVDNFVEATHSDTTDQEAVQVAGKAKAVGRKYSSLLINGTGANEEFVGLLGLVSSGQTLTAGTNGADVSFSLLDELLDAVKAKDGKVDFLMMHARTIRSVKTLLRGQSGAGIIETLTLPSGEETLVYEGVPIFRNDWVPTNQTQGSSTTCTSIIAGCLDDGSRKVGIAGLHAKKAMGIQVKALGESESKDESITRVKFYCGLACYSDLALAVVKGISN